MSSTSRISPLSGSYQTKGPPQVRSPVDRGEAGLGRRLARLGEDRIDGHSEPSSNPLGEETCLVEAPPAAVGPRHRHVGDRVDRSERPLLAHVGGHPLREEPSDRAFFLELKRADEVPPAALVRPQRAREVEAPVAGAARPAEIETRSLRAALRTAGSAALRRGEVPSRTAGRGDGARAGRVADEAPMGKDERKKALRDRAPRPTIRGAAPPARAGSCTPIRCRRTSPP